MTSAVSSFKARTLENYRGCWIWRHATAQGYGVVTRRRQKEKTKLVHRIIWEMVNGPIPPGIFVLHACDDRACINPEHLFLGTRSDNAIDALKKGRPVGPPPKLTPQKVQEIRATVKANPLAFYKDIAEIYGLDPRVVCAIVRGDVWSWVS